MALNPNYLQSLPDSLVDMYGLVEMDILEDMARRISTYDFFIPSAQHQNQKLLELGAVQEEIINKLSSMTGKTNAEIVSLLTEAGETAIADDVEYYKAADVYSPSKVNTEALYRQLNSGLLQTEQAFKNITRTTANTATKQFENALDRAWTQINIGGFDYTTAIKRAITDLASQGVGSVEYKSGRVDNIEVAVRRAVVTGANQTVAKTQEALADELEVDLVEVTAHGGARPSHAKWQGQVFSRNGKKTIDGVIYKDLKSATRYGKADGLCGVNCRHNFHPYIHGTSRTWNDEEIKKLDEKNIEYNGEKLTEYEASQKQRAIEREIRKQKRIVNSLEAAGEDASEYRTKLREAQNTYTNFTKQTGLKKQQARTQVPNIENSRFATIQGNEQTLEKVNFTGVESENAKKEIEKEINKIPAPHRELAERKITTVEISNTAKGSSYSAKNKKIIISQNSTADAIVHEYAHALEDVLDVYNDPKFMQIMYEGLENISLSDIIYDETTFTKPIFRIENKKFISIYQGRLYEESGIYNGAKISLEGMKEYFSEGYREYISNPENLKKHDPKLYAYFKEL